MSATGGMLLEEKEEIERQLREANSAVQGAEAQLRTLLSELGQSAEEMQELLRAIKASPSDFKEDPGRAKKALAEAMLQKMSIEIKFAEQLRTQRDAEARAARAAERGTQEAALFARYVQQASEQVKLNVGGEIFTTSKSAMLAADEGSLLEVLYSGRQGTPPSPLFLDRDPALFVYVLRFLRAAGAGQANIGPGTLMIPTEYTAAAVLEEARFFGLKQLEGVLLEVFFQFRREKIQNLVENRDVDGDLSRHVVAVVCEMKKHPDRVGMQEEGCHALEVLARDKAIQVQVARAGGVEAVVDGMKKHPGSAKLQRHGCIALWHLCQNEANKGYCPRVAACFKSLDGVAKKVLVEAGVDVDAKNNGGYTPLIWACRNKEEGMARMLVEAGADVNAKSNDDYTPLIWACERREEGMARMLVEAGADVNAKANSGNTPLIWACRNKEEGMARMLVEAGADVNAKANSGDTPLIFACSNQEEGMARMLVEAGADVNAKNNGGYTPLIRACEFKEQGMARMLVEAGADVNAKANSGWTPLISACGNKEEGMARMLVEAGADVNAKNNDGLTPLKAARGHAGLEQLLRAKGARE